MSKSRLERDFAFQLYALGIRDFEREYRFHPKRRWRFDFAWPDRKIACECEGGLFRARSGHRSFYGVKRDILKNNDALLLGWMVLRLTSEEIKSGKGAEMLQRLLKGDKNDFR
jgi:very-short-patch-repair endonuclease